MRPTGTAARRLAFLLCLGLLCALGCGEDREPEAPAAPVAQGPAAPGPAPLEVELPPLPPPGEVTLELTGATFSLLANQAPRRAVLRKLKLVRDFELILADQQAARGVVTLRLVEATLEQGLVATLSGVAFSLHYAPFENLSLVDGVTVGGAAKGELAGGNAGEQRRAKRKELRKKLRAGRGREQAELSEEERRQQREEAAAELGRGLESPDARSRAGAVGMLGEEGAAELADHLANDRSPEVRAASAQALGSLTATRAGTSALVAALDDPDPQVVLAALDSLQWIDDPSVLPDVQKVLDHPNPEVREAAAETVSWLE